MKLLTSVFLSVWFASVISRKVDFFNSSVSRTPPVTHLDMVRLVDLCYSGASNPVAVTENFVGTLQENLNNAIEFPIILIDNVSVSNGIQLYNPTHPLYILPVNSIGQLVDLIKPLKSLPFWSIKSTFFIITDIEKSCRDSVEVLRFLWKFELLSSFVVCSKIDYETMLYTFNPYANRGPKSWTPVQTLNRGQKPGSFYKKPFKNDPDICESLHFDKTKNLDPYPAKIITRVRFEESLREFVFPSLGMIQHVKNWDEQYNDLKIVDFLVIGDRDITTDLYSDSINSNKVNVIPVTYEISYVIVTQKRSFVFEFNDVVLLLDSKTIITILAIFFSIFVFTLMNNRYHLSSAIFNIFRLLIGTELNFSFGRLSMKFIFFVATTLMIFFEPLIESQVLALLSRPQSYTIETLKDLHDHQYHVYFAKTVHDGIIKEKLWTTDEDMKFLHPIPSYSLDDCLEFVTENESVACVFQADYSIETAIEMNLHISKNFILKKRSFIWSRNDWALNDRVYHRLLNVHEVGYRDFAIKIHIRSPLKQLKAQDKMKKIEYYDEITDENFHGFWLFIVGWQLFGVFVFAIEHLIGRLRH